MLYNDSLSKATEIFLKGCIPNIRSGGKVKATQQKVASFVAGIEGQNLIMKKNAQVCNAVTLILLPWLRFVELRLNRILKVLNLIEGKIVSVLLITSF